MQLIVIRSVAALMGKATDTDNRPQLFFESPNIKRSPVPATRRSMVSVLAACV